MHVCQVFSHLQLPMGSRDKCAGHRSGARNKHTARKPHGVLTDHSNPGVLCCADAARHVAVRADDNAKTLRAWQAHASATRTVRLHVAFHTLF